MSTVYPRQIEALASYQRALELARNDAERRFRSRWLAELSTCAAAFT